MQTEHKTIAYNGIDSLSLAIRNHFCVILIPGSGRASRVRGLPSGVFPIPSPLDLKNERLPAVEFSSFCSNRSTPLSAFQKENLDAGTSSKALTSQW